MHDARLTRKAALEHLDECQLLLDVRLGIILGRQWLCSRRQIPTARQRELNGAED